MKALLNYSKNIENDFPIKSNEYRSKIELGVTSLNSSDYKKAKDMFDGAIELDSSHPSGWLGKAFAEIAQSSEEQFNELQIDEYIERALKSKNKLIVNYKVAIAGCLAFRHAEIIKRNVIRVEEYLKAVEEAKKKKKQAQVAAVVGTMFTGKDKSITSNVIGASLIAGGVASAYSSDLKGKEFQLLANSQFSAALGQTYLSSPVIYLCGSLLEKINDNNLKSNFEVVINSWKDSVLYLFEKQKDQLIQKLNSLDFNRADTIDDLLKDYNSVQEIGEFTVFMKIIGLSKHPIFTSIDNIFKVKLKSTFNSKESKENLEAAKKKQHFGYFLMAISVGIGIGSVFFIDGKNLEGVPWIIDLVGIGLGLFIVYGSRTSEMKSFNGSFKEFKNKLAQVQIKQSDIDINLVKQENGKKDNNLLDI